VSELPLSWIECQLGEILKIRHGYAFKSMDFTNEGVPLLRQANLAGDTVDLSNCVYLPNYYLEEYQRFSLRVGDILIGMSGSIGKLCIYDKPYPALQNQRIGKIDWISVQHVHDRYVWHFLKTIEDTLVEKGKGVAIANVSAGDIESISVPLAPLNEQKRIADKLDGVLAWVDACRERLDRVPAILKRFRQAVLTAATSGKLTEEWRASNETERWRTVNLSEVAKSRLGKMLDKVKNRGTATPYLRNINVRWFGFDLSDIQTIRVTEDEARELVVERGDVLICEGGEPGRCAVWQGIPEGAPSCSCRSGVNT
jgi:type I restriction enzyme S subunit